MQLGSELGAARGEMRARSEMRAGPAWPRVWRKHCVRQALRVTVAAQQLGGGSSTAVAQQLQPPHPLPLACVRFDHGFRGPTRSGIGERRRGAGDLPGPLSDTMHTRRTAL